MQFIKRFRVGQRAIKTAVSVGLALALAMVLGSSLPIFAAIGAISVMSRTWVDSLKESLNQIAGTFLGYLIACWAFRKEKRADFSQSASAGEQTASSCNIPKTDK